jgi:hypothetical protein
MGSFTPICLNEPTNLDSPTLEGRSAYTSWQIRYAHSLFEKSVYRNVGKETR